MKSGNLMVTALAESKSSRAGAASVSLRSFVTYWSMGLLLAFLNCNAAFGAGATVQDDEDSEAGVKVEALDQARQPGHLVRIPMPIVGNVAERAIGAIDRILEKVTTEVDGKRPILVVEFDNRNGTNGVGSRFEDCLKLARYLTSAKMNKLRTVAYLPGPGNVPQELFAEGEVKRSTFESHVVLVALSCEEIAMHKDAAIGNAGADVESLDELLSTAYRVMAEKRRVFPPLVALSMLEKQRVVYRVELKDDGVKYVEDTEYQEIIAAGKDRATITMAGPNNFGFFTSEDLQNYRLIRHRVDSRKDLADRYNLSATALEGDPSLGENWKAVRISINGVITARMVTWIENALSTRIDEDQTNMIIVELESAGGEAEAAMRLANRLSEFDPMKVRTIAYIPERARGVSSIVAMGCDHLVMNGEADMGGESRPPLKPEELVPIKEGLKSLAKKKRNQLVIFSMAWSITPLRSNNTSISGRGECESCPLRKRI